MRTPNLHDFMNDEVAFICTDGDFLYFTEYNNEDSYAVKLNVVRWKISNKSVYSFLYSVTELGQYYDDDTWSERSALAIGI